MRSLIFLLALVTLVSPVTAQFKFRETPNREDAADLSHETRERVWEHFQENRRQGDYRMSAELSFRPARGSRERVFVNITSEWDEARQLLRIWPAGDFSKGRAIAIHGSEIQLGKLDTEGDAEWPEEGTATSDSLMDGFPFTAEDLAMTYLDWPVVEYLGGRRFLGRPAHAYLLREPVPSQARQAEVLVDEDYGALLSIRLLDAEGLTAESVRIGGFKQFDGVWGFRDITWQRRSTRESVQLFLYSLDVANSSLPK